MYTTTFLNDSAVRGPGIEPGRVTPPDPKFGEFAPFLGEKDSESFSVRPPDAKLPRRQRRGLSRKGIADRAARVIWWGSSRRARRRFWSRAERVAADVGCSVKLGARIVREREQDDERWHRVVRGEMTPAQLVAEIRSDVCDLAREMRR